MEKRNGGNANSYSEKSLRSKLKEKYRLHINFTNLPRQPNIIFFRDIGSYILDEEKKKTGGTKVSIITAVAKLLKVELRDLVKLNKVPGGPKKTHPNTKSSYFTNRD